MANMTQELIKRQVACFGMTMEEVEAEYQHAAPMYDRLMFAMSILSDAQEAMQRGMTEMARQFINKAKYHMDCVRGK
jgi:hypothetical protein